MSIVEIDDFFWIVIDDYERSKNLRINRRMIGRALNLLSCFPGIRNSHAFQKGTNPPLNSQLGACLKHFHPIECSRKRLFVDSLFELQ